MILQIPPSYAQVPFLTIHTIDNLHISHCNSLPVGRRNPVFRCQLAILRHKQAENWLSRSTIQHLRNFVIQMRHAVIRPSVLLTLRGEVGERVVPD